MQTRNRLAGFSLLFLLGTSFLTVAQADRTAEGRYGEKVKFAEHAKIAFPDFTLEYVGQHRESSPKYPRGFLFYDFVSKFKGGSVQFSWTSGTGDIGPAGFGINQTHFALELKRSDKLGPLKEDELVVWKN
jgi:hypothetical protein